MISVRELLRKKKIFFSVTFTLNEIVYQNTLSRLDCSLHHLRRKKIRTEIFIKTAYVYKQLKITKRQNVYHNLIYGCM